jgi:hypothetical protein
MVQFCQSKLLEDMEDKVSWVCRMLTRLSDLLSSEGYNTRTSLA